MRFREHTTNDVEEIFAEVGRWETRATQLTRGALGYRSTLVDLDEIDLCWFRADQAIRSEERSNGRGRRFSITFLLEGAAPTRLWGRDLEPGQALLDLDPPPELEYVTASSTASLLVSAEPESLGISDAAAPIRRIVPASGPEGRQVVEVCRRVTRTVRDAPRLPAGMVAGLGLAVTAALRAYLVRLNRDCRNGPAPDPAREHRLLRQADAWLTAHAPDRPASVQELAAALRVSDRTLHRAFRNLLGMGPYQYQSLRRLHDFRAHLVRSKPYPGIIADAAGRTGFDHLGRLSATYRRHFGELPSETVRRRSAETGRTT